MVIQEGLVQPASEYTMSCSAWDFVKVYSHFLNGAYDLGLRGHMINVASWKPLLNYPKGHCMEVITT